MRSAVLCPRPGLTDSCRECASHCLQYLNDLKSQANLQRANPSAIRYTVQRILAMGQVRGNEIHHNNKTNAALMQAAVTTVVFR